MQRHRLTATSTATAYGTRGNRARAASRTTSASAASTVTATDARGDELDGDDRRDRDAAPTRSRSSTRSRTKLRVTFADCRRPTSRPPHGTGSQTSVQFVDVATERRRRPTTRVNVPEDYAQNNAPLVTAIQYAGLTSSSPRRSPTIVSTPWSQNYTALASDTSNPAGEEPDWDGRQLPRPHDSRDRRSDRIALGDRLRPDRKRDLRGRDLQAPRRHGPARHRRHLQGVERARERRHDQRVRHASPAGSTSRTISGCRSTWARVATDATRGLGDARRPGTRRRRLPPRRQGRHRRARDRPAAGSSTSSTSPTRSIYRDRPQLPRPRPPCTSYNPGFDDRRAPVGAHRSTAVTSTSATSTTGETARPAPTRAVGRDASRCTFDVKTRRRSRAPATWTSCSPGASATRKGRGRARPVGQETALEHLDRHLELDGANGWRRDVDDRGVELRRSRSTRRRCSPTSPSTPTATCVSASPTARAMQGGNRNYSATSCPANNPVVYETFSNGDLLIAAPGAGGAYTLESNGVVGTRTLDRGPGERVRAASSSSRTATRSAPVTSTQENTLGAIATMLGSSRRRRDRLRPAERHPGRRPELVRRSRPAPSTPATSTTSTPAVSAGSTGTFQKGGGIGDIDAAREGRPAADRQPGLVRRRPGRRAGRGRAGRRRTSRCSCSRARQSSVRRRPTRAASTTSRAPASAPSPRTVARTPSSS